MQWNLTGVGPFCCCLKPLDPELIRRAVCTALDEDVGQGDATTLATVPQDIPAKGRIVAREPLVMAGLALAQCTFAELSGSVEVRPRASDGDRLEKRQTLMELSGPARAILTGERVALNFLQRLSGVATLTARYVEAVRGSGARILDTRKTTPGWRLLEKYAVVCGGGHNHRIGLYDMVLIKDNHLVALQGESPNAITAAVKRARTAYPHLKVEVEADTIGQVKQAVEAGADIVLLDNMTLEQLQESVAICRGRCVTEASGGVNLETVRSIANTGVDFISVGALTHSARAVDIALDFDA